MNRLSPLYEPDGRPLFPWRFTLALCLVVATATHHFSYYFSLSLLLSYYFSRWSSINVWVGTDHSGLVGFHWMKSTKRMNGIRHHLNDWLALLWLALEWGTLRRRDGSDLRIAYFYLSLSSIVRSSLCPDLRLGFLSSQPGTDTRTILACWTSGH